jgi:lipoprotein-releasing system permease protein
VRGEFTRVYGSPHPNLLPEEKELNAECMKLAFTIALRSLFSKKSRYAHSAIGWIAIIGLTLGVGAQSVAVSILGGFEKSFTQSILGFNAHLVLMREGEIEDPVSTLHRLQSFEGPHGITSITPFLYREGLLAYHSKVKGVVFKGIDSLTFGKVYDVKIRLFSNTSSTGESSKYQKDFFKQRGEYPLVLLGSDLADELGIKSEDRIVSVFSPQGEIKKIGDVNSFTRFEVVGTFSSGLYEYDSQFTLLSLGFAQKFFKAENRVTGFEMRVGQTQEARNLAHRLEESFAPPFQAIAWDELNAEIFQALRLEKKLFFIIMGLIVLVAAANLVGLIVVLVAKQSKEVSIFRAMGMPPKTLTKIFTFQGMILACIGIGLGSVVGWVVSFYLSTHSLIPIAKEVYLVSSLPIALSWKNFFWVVFFALGISYLATQLAARRVMKMELDL